MTIPPNTSITQQKTRGFWFLYGIKVLSALRLESSGSDKQ